MILLMVINSWRMEESGEMELVGKLLSLEESMEALFVQIIAFGKA